MNNLEKIDINNLNKFEVNIIGDKYISLHRELSPEADKNIFLLDRFTMDEYIVKLPKKEYKTWSSYNDHISEFLGSNIIQYLGYPSQDTYLVKSGSIPESVMVKLFEYPLTKLSSKIDYFYNMENNALDLDKILNEYKIHSNINHMDTDKFNQFLVKMLIVDYIIVNIDRNSGNIGFFRDNNGNYYPSPFYDSGVSLLTQYFYQDWDKMIKNHQVVNYKVIKDGKRCKFEDVLREISNNIGNSEYYMEEIQYILNNYNKNKSEIHKLIDTIIKLDDKYIDIAESIKELLEFTIRELKNLIGKNKSDNSVLGWE